MRKFYSGVVSLRVPILIAYVILFIICTIMNTQVAVDYDMNDYLPSESASTVALDVMDEEFGSGVPNARVMVKNVTIPEALEYKDKIAAVDGVSDVTWLDDAVSINVPLETMDTDTLETYYKDNNALFSVTIDKEKRVDAVNSIREIIGDDNAMTGSAVSTATATSSTLTEVKKISIIGVAFVIFVLIFTTESFFEPVIIMIGLGVAIMLNSGSNLIFGEISFVTNAAGKVLQLAVSLDYSVFLIHRFTEERKKFNNPKDAMIEALTMSTSSILSSGLTTVIGFLALCLMQFRIGPDLGLALAKGIAIGLITVFTFMPALILSTYKLLDKFLHRRLLPSCEKLGHLKQLQLM